MCKTVKRSDGWRIVAEDENKYAYKGYQWISVEDKYTIRAKAEYVRDQKLFGAAVYSINYDDVNNLCGKGNFPLLNEIHRILIKENQ